MKIFVRTLLMGLLATVLLSGCTAHYPADPHHTLLRVTDGVLRVGISHNEPFTSVVGPEPSGREVDLVRRYAESLNAEIEWTTDGEEDLVEQLEHGELDLVAGGLTKQTPWKKRIGITNPYTTTTNEFGKTEKHVLAVRQGENAFLMDLQRFLQHESGQP